LDTLKLARNILYQGELSPSFLGWNRENHTPSMLNEAGLIGCLSTTRTL